jgi:hypothetical protein
LPTEEELENELPKEIYFEVRGYFNTKPDLESDEILNVTIVILKAHDPIATTKNLSFLKRIQNLLDKYKPRL